MMIPAKRLSMQIYAFARLYACARVCVCVYVFCISHILHMHSKVNVYRIAFRCHADTQSRQCVTRLSGKQQINAPMARIPTHTHTHARARAADTAQYNCCHRVQERRAHVMRSEKHTNMISSLLLQPPSLSSPRIATRDSRMRTRVGACPRRRIGFARFQNITFDLRVRVHSKFSSSRDGCVSRRADRSCCTVCDFRWKSRLLGA